LSGGIELLGENKYNHQNGGITQETWNLQKERQWEKGGYDKMLMEGGSLRKSNVPLCVSLQKGGGKAVGFWY